VNSGWTAAPSSRVSTSATRAGRLERWWQVFAGLSAAALTWWYVAEHRHPSANGYRNQVIALGCLGTTLAVMAAALSIRKRLAYQGAGKLSVWMSAHIYLGVVAAFAILYHSGFRSGGLLSTLLLAFFWLTVASGLLGWRLSRSVPLLLTAMEETPAILEDLLLVRAECLRGMLELADSGSPEFRALVARRLMKETKSWGRMLRFYRRRSTLAQELPAFQGEQDEALKQLKEVEHRAYRRAVEYALRINKMNAELFLQRVLRGWLTLHMATTVAMFGLAGIHIISVLYY